MPQDSLLAEAHRFAASQRTVVQPVRAITLKGLGRVQLRTSCHQAGNNGSQPNN
jgi:hypothetical protein